MQSGNRIFKALLICNNPGVRTDSDKETDICVHSEKCFNTNLFEERDRVFQMLISREVLFCSLRYLAYLWSIGGEDDM